MLALITSNPPSQQGISTTFNDLQHTNCRDEWTQPSATAITTPVTLLHPIFSQFVLNSHDLEPSKTTPLLSIFPLKCPGFSMMRPVNRLPSPISFVTISYRWLPVFFTGYTINGDDLYMNGCCYVIIEVKNEVGFKGTDRALLPSHKLLHGWKWGAGPDCCPAKP